MATTTPNTSTNLNIAYLDFDTIKASLRDFMRSQSYFRDYNFEGSGLTILLNLLAYNTHYFGFYLNMLSSEMFLDSASLRSSVVSIAKQLGYTPRSTTSAQATVSITITPNDNASAAVIDYGTQFTAAVNGTTYTFITSQAYGTTIQGGVFSFPSVNLIEGSPFTFRITVNSSIPGQRFIIPNAGVDTSTLTVYVQASVTDTTLTSYVLATDLLQLTPSTNVYFLQEVENSLYEVYFGDGILGSAVVDGNIVIIEYVLSDGTGANGASTFTPASTVAGYQSYLTTVTTLAGAAGGKDPETITSIKFNAPKNYETQGRAVTVSDYTNILVQQYTNLDSVAVWGGEDNDPPQYGKVFISIQPVTGFVLTDTLKELVVSNILRQRNIVSVIPDIVDPDYIYIIINCTVKYNPGNTFNTDGDIRSEAYDAILNYASSNLNQFYLQLQYSRLGTAIDNADPAITNNLTTLQMKKIFQPALDVVANYSFLLNNPIVPGSLISTSFVTVNDPLLLIAYTTGTTYTISDDGKGNLQMIQSGIGIANSVVRKCGTVNYATGAILIQEIIPSAADVNGNISLIMSPAVNDITPLRNNILFIQPQDINVTVIPNPPIAS